MGINDARNTGNNDAAQERAQSAAPQFDESQVRQAAPHRKTITGKGGVNALLSRRLNRVGGNEDISKIAEMMRSYLRSQLDEGYVPTFVIVDGVTYELAVSAIVPSVMLTARGVKTVLAYPILVEPRDRSMDTVRTVREAGRELSLPVVTSDFYDARTEEQIRNAIVRQFGLNAADSDIKLVGYCTLPVEVSSDDKGEIEDLAANVFSALESWVREQPGSEEPRFNLAEIDNTQTRFTGKLDFSPAPIKTLTGLPVRNDVTITTKMRDITVDSLHSQSGVLSELSGYVDLIYVDPQPEQNPYTRQMYLNPACYLPNFVISHQEILVNAVTPELVLFGLASARLMQQPNNAFYNAFKPRHGVKNDTRDIGAIGYEFDPTGEGKGPKAPIDTADSTFNLQTLLSTAFRPGLLYSLDVVDGGEYSWVYEALLYAANGDAAAENDVIQYADNLTNGHFRQLWNPVENRVAVDSGDLIPIGYYIDPEGQRKDLRDIDYLALLNMFGGSDAELVYRWSETFGNPNQSPQQRLDARVRILKSLLSNNLFIKRIAHRITLTPTFIDVLATAISKAGITIVPETVFSEQQTYTRGSTTLANYALTGGQSPLFAGMQQQTVAGYNTVYQPRGAGSRFGG